jgi:hypothetical protein
VYRGVKADIAKDYPSGQEVAFYGITSTSESIEVMKNFVLNIEPGDPPVAPGAHKGVIFTIELTQNRNCSIADLSFYPEEKEVLLPPNAIFTVVGQVCLCPP